MRAEGRSYSLPSSLCSLLSALCPLPSALTGFFPSYAAQFPDAYPASPTGALLRLSSRSPGMNESAATVGMKRIWDSRLNGNML